MANDLVRIVQGTASSLATQPSQYSTQLELFVGRDEKVLSEFLRKERDEKPHYRRHKDWEMLVGKPERYLRPKKYMEKQIQEFPELEKQLKDMLSEEKLLEMGVSSDTIAVFGDFPAMIYQMLDMQTKLYESVVAHAKQIGDERKVEPIDVVKSSEGRDEVYRRIFQTRDQFEWYHNISAQLGITVLGVVYNRNESFEKIIRDVESLESVDWLTKRKINKAKREMKKAQKKLPPKAVAKSFLREEIAYDAKRAERIYGGIQKIIK
ncbi:hypothetical protein ACFL0X_00320 [Nanoarchaeota archaeon]